MHLGICEDAKIGHICPSFIYEENASIATSSQIRYLKYTQHVKIHGWFEVKILKSTYQWNEETKHVNKN